MTALRCVLVGENALVLECAGLLLERGHAVRLLVSASPDVRRTAESRGIATLDAGADLADALTGAPFDYLFSIGNPRFLPERVLSLPRKLAINFHDALLPRHAGTHAIPWAICSGDTRHGVTWHVMTTRFDAGDIVKQRSVDVPPHATTHTVSLQCYEAGVAAFAELIDELDRDAVARVPQDLAGRTFHARHDRLPRCGVVSWQQPAEEIAAWTRACDFGPQTNSFGTVKIAIGGELVVARDAAVRGVTGASPGTVLAASDDQLTVATATRAISFCDLRSLDGDVLVPSGLTRSGMRLRDLEESEAVSMAWNCRNSARHEAFWVDRLRDVRPLDLPYPATSMPEPLPMPFAALRKPWEWKVAALLAFLTRVAGEDEIDVGLRIGAEEWRGLLAKTVPFRVPRPAGDESVDRYAARVTRELEAAAARGSHLRDVVLRYPGVRPLEAYALPVTIDAAERRILVRADGAIGEHFAAFVAGAADEPSRAASRIALLRGRERRRVLIGWNDTAAAVPHDRGVHQLFAEQVRLRPDAPAVTCEGRVLSYAELDRRSSRLAAYLASQHGIGSGALVALYLDRSEDLVVALLGVMKCGAAYLPLDPVYPPQRIADMLADSGASLALTHAHLEPNLHGIATVAVDRDADAIAAIAADVPDRAGDLAYVIYTSGSEGRPKGVKIGHRALTNALWSSASTPGLTESDRLLAVTTICFDIAALELLLPLVVGAEVDVAPARVVSDGFALRDHMDRTRPTVMQATPATWKMLLDAGWKGDPSLTIFCGGEALPRELAETLLPRCAALWNLFGPTETTIWSSIARIEPGEAVTIGRPIANTRFYVVDRAGQPLPPGLPGELLIAGNGLADGYHERPELTAKKFVASAIEEERGLVYRTGDLVRYLPDGRLEHLRRIDQQVKIDGRRVELGEIEQMLRTEEQVRDAAVIVREDGRRPRLVAYVAGAGPVDAGRLRRRLAERLPAYMVPHELVLLDALPLTPNGKIDRKALPAPAQSASPGAQPRSESERAVAAAWCAVLERDAVGIDDNFFDLGGTSLLLPPLVARLRELDPRTGIVEVFQHPTVRTMAQWLGRGDTDPGARATASRAARDRTPLERRRFERVRNHEDDSGEELYAGVPVVPHRK